MGDNVSLLRLDGRSALLRLIASLLFTVITGTILFWLFIFCGSLIFNTSMSDMIVIPDAGAGTKQLAILRFVQVSQQIGLFLIPALLIGLLFNSEKESYLKMNCGPGILSFIMIIALVIIVIPVISWTGVINSSMDLPDWLSGLEKIFREKEARASEIMGFLIKSEGLGGLALSIVILSIVPSLAEEFLFRGVFQSQFIKVFRSSHAGIWFTAILFSAVHFQFYGFLPRLILGLLFGYLVLWTGSIWSSVAAHLLNNSIPVITMYTSRISEGATYQAGDPIGFPFIQIIVTALIVYGIWYFSSRRVNSKESSGYSSGYDR